MAQYELGSADEHLAPVKLPRITIVYCTQCRWMLRAAYFAQELLSTFSSSLGEVSLIPSTGGVFTIEIIHHVNTPDQHAESKGKKLQTEVTRLWDRKTVGGFPEVKHLKQLVRNIIDPSRDLGHVDRHTQGATASGDEPQNASEPTPSSKDNVTEHTQNASNKRAETTIPTDPDAAIATGPPEESKGHNINGGKGEVCEDCK